MRVKLQGPSLCWEERSRIPDIAVAEQLRQLGLLGALGGLARRSAGSRPPTRRWIGAGRDSSLGRMPIRMDRAAVRPPVLEAVCVAPVSRTCPGSGREPCGVEAEAEPPHQMAVWKLWSSAMS